MSRSVYDRYRASFVEAIAAALGSPAAEIQPQVKDADPAHGDLSFPTFPLAKALKKAPPAIAADLATRVKAPGLSIAAAGPYLNARFDPQPFTGEVLAAAREAGAAYGSSDAGRGRTV